MSLSVAEPILVAETSDVRQFARLLRGIGLKHNAVMTVSQAGFEVTVEDARSLCATAWIPSNIFSTYFYTSDAPALFELSLDALLQCLNIFGGAAGGAGGARERLPAAGSGSGGGRGGGGGGSGRKRWAGDAERDPDEEQEWSMERRRERKTGMRLTWSGEGYPLSVLLRDDSKGPVTTCELYTLEPEELMNQPFDESNRAVYLIMKSEWLRDALLDLPPSCTRVTLRVLPRDIAGGGGEEWRKRGVGTFSIYAEGDFGTVQFDYPNEKDVMDAFECEEAITFSYHAAHIVVLARALLHSLKICLQIEETGFMSVQIMMPIPESMAQGEHTGILDFKMHALEDDDDE